MLRAAAVVVVAVCVAAPAQASNLIDRDVANAKLVVTPDGAAHLLYSKAGRAKHVVAYDAVNARFPARGARQVEFEVNYSAGWRTPYHAPDPSKLVNACGRYRGPALPWFLAACTARDGSHWALQTWQRMLPNFGRVAGQDLAATDLRLSHWTGELPVFTVKQDWAYAGRWDHLYGSLTYLGRPMFGFGTTSYGSPLDSWGVLVYVDVFGSPWGRGWKRVDSFVTHNPTGIFCYTLSDKGNRPAGEGSRYRATVVGPGVLPDLLWESKAPGAYDKSLDDASNREQWERFTDKACRPN